MLSQIALRRFPMLLRQSVRFLSTPAEPAKPATKPDEAKPTGSSSSSAHLRSATHKVDNLERKMLVWTGKYKSAEEVPSYVNQDVMEKTRNKIRIRMANIMMLITAVACLFMVYSGKQAADRGETVQKQNLDWHKEYNEKSKAEAEAKAADGKKK